MGSMEKGFVYYCCVAKGGRILQSYDDGNNSSDCVGDSEIEKLAALCLEKVPQYHRWYSETKDKRTYCFLMEDGFVYFAIAEDGLGNHALIGFLEHYRDEFKRIAKRGSGLRLSWKGKGKGKGKGSMSSSNLNSANLQEQLVPVIRQLITSLQNVRQSENDNGNGSVLNSSSSPCGGCYGETVESASSTKAPLLGMKPGKQEKRSKDHVIAMRGIELEEQRKSGERGLRPDSCSDDTGATGSPMQMQEMSASARRRSSSQIARRRWCRLMWLVLAIDGAVCMALLVIWLVICKGIQCIRH